MYSNDELVSILLQAIANHPSLDHKLHLMNAVEDLFDKVESYEKALKYISTTDKIGLTHQWHSEEFREIATKALEEGV